MKITSNIFQIGSLVLFASTSASAQRSFPVGSRSNDERDLQILGNIANLAFGLAEGSIDFVCFFLPFLFFCPDTTRVDCSVLAQGDCLAASQWCAYEDLGQFLGDICYDYTAGSGLGPCDRLTSVECDNTSNCNLKYIVGDESAICEAECAAHTDIFRCEARPDCAFFTIGSRCVEYAQTSEFLCGGFDRDTCRDIFGCAVVFDLIDGEAQCQLNFSF